MPPLSSKRFILRNYIHAVEVYRKDRQDPEMTAQWLGSIHRAGPSTTYTFRPHDEIMDLTSQDLAELAVLVQEATLDAQTARQESM